MNETQPEPFHFYGVLQSAITEAFIGINNQAKAISKSKDPLLLPKLATNLSIVHHILRIKEKADKLVLLPNLEIIESAKAAAEDYTQIIDKRQKANSKFEDVKKNMDNIINNDSKKGERSRKSIRKPLNMVKRSKDQFKSLMKTVDEWTRVESKLILSQSRVLDRLVPPVDDEESIANLHEYTTFEERVGIVDLTMKSMPSQEVQAMLAFTTKQLVDTPDNLISFVSAIQVSCSPSQFKKTLQIIRLATGHGMFKMLQNMHACFHETEEVVRPQSPVVKDIRMNDFDDSTSTEVTSKHPSSFDKFRQDVQNEFDNNTEHIGGRCRAISLTDILQSDFSSVQERLQPQRRFSIS